MTKQDIIDLLVSGEVSNAIKALRAAAPNDNTILNLAGQWNRLQRDKLANVVSKEYATLTENQITNSLLEMARRLPEGIQVQVTLDPPVAAVGGATATPPTDGKKQPVVFLSYNHNDVDDATRVKSYLEGRGIKVTIDAEAMLPGEDIADFISRSIRDADVTLSLVSPNSLLSAWVGMETMNTLVAEKVAGKDFVAVVIDNSFYEIDFVRKSTKVIDARIKKLDKEIALRRKDKIGIEDIQHDLTRNEELRNDLAKIVANLKSRLNVDISGTKFDAGMERVAKKILGN